MGKGVRHVISCVASVLVVDPIRSVSGARKFHGTLRQGPKLPDRQEDGFCGCRRTNLLRHGHGLYLVLERGAVPAAVGGHRVSPETLWHTSSDGHWSAANAVQSARVGGSR